jgi:DNA-binding SARP family transcriptional activator/BarA-like signal transduction histidine kinase
MHLLSIQLFGGFAARDHRGNTLSMASHRAEALVIYLALRLDSGGSAEEAAALLDGEPLDEVIADVRRTLRFVPGEILIHDGGALRFNPLAVTVDAQRFEFLAARNSLTAVGEAAELYIANLLEGYTTHYPPFNEWVAEQRLRYWQLGLNVFARLLAPQIRAGWWERASETASRLLSLDPSQEVVHRTLMRLQLEQGRPDAALRRYQECADILRRDFGRAPEGETERVRAEIVAALERSPAPRELMRVPPGQPTLILLLEDDAVSSALLEGFLSEAGYEVVCVADGAEALMEIGRRRFDLLILDVNVPTLSGLRLFEVMIQKGIQTPAIFITGLSGSEAEARSLEMGAADFLRKPIRKETLLPRVRAILQRRERAFVSGPHAAE